MGRGFFKYPGWYGVNLYEPVRQFEVHSNNKHEAQESGHWQRDPGGMAMHGDFQQDTLCTLQSVWAAKPSR